MIKVKGNFRNWKIDEVGDLIINEMVETKVGFIMSIEQGNFLVANFFDLGSGSDKIEINLAYKAWRLPLKTEQWVTTISECEDSLNAGISHIMQPVRDLHLSNIENRGYTKKELFNLTGVYSRYRAVDGAIPQEWLDHFSEWATKQNPRVTYDVILSTTGWAYDDGSFSGPVSVCKEVNALIANYWRHCAVNYA